MKESTKFWLSCTPFLLIGVAVLLSSSISEFMAKRREEVWARDPMTMQITVSKPTEADSSHRHQTVGDTLLFEVGLLRLALPAKGVRGGGSGSSCRIATASHFGGGGGSSSGTSGSHKRSHKDADYGSHHEFSGPGYSYQFNVRQGCLCIGDQRVCILDTPKLVILRTDGAIRSITELSVSYPPLKGSAADVASLIEKAQKYAKVPPADFPIETWISDPLTRQLEVKSPTEATSNSRWHRGKALVFETALLRLIIPTMESTGAYSTQVSTTVATTTQTDELAHGLRGSDGSGPTPPHAARLWKAGCSSHRVFSGSGYSYNFDIIQGCLCIKGLRVCILDTPKLVILRTDGSIESVRELTVVYPKPSGTPEDIQALTQTAKQFAARFQP